MELSSQVRAVVEMDWPGSFKVATGSDFFVYVKSPHKICKVYLELFDAVVAWFDLFNASPLSVAYMRQWIGSALVQTMACRLFGTKPLSKPMQGFVNWTLRKKLQWNLTQIKKLFIHENAFENIVCETAPILLRERWVDTRAAEWQATPFTVLATHVDPNQLNLSATISIPWLKFAHLEVEVSARWQHLCLLP